jgi:hypothetical protein
MKPSATPAMHQIAATEEGCNTPQNLQPYLSGFDFANQRVINLRNEWTHIVSVCRGTPP